MRSLLLTLVALWLGSGSRAHAQSRPAFLDQSAQVRVVGKSGAGERLPLVVALPCTGCSAESVYQYVSSQLGLARYVLLLPQGTPSTKDYLPAFGKFVGWYEERLLADLKQTLSTQPVDPERVYLLGFSLGGDLACALVARHPELFRGAFIMSSRCTSALSKSAAATLSKRDVRLAFAMGSADDAARIAGIKQAEQRAAAQGIRTRYLTFEGRHELPPLEVVKEGLALLLAPAAASRPDAGVPAKPPR